MKINKKEVIFIIAITLIALILRLINIEHSKLWIDELYCFDIASKANILEILKTVFLKDLHAPFFFIILHFWIKCFDSSDIALLALPVVFSTLSIPAGYFIAKKLFNTKTAVIFAILCTISALEITYAQELKFYSLLPLLGLISTYFFLQITQSFDFKKALWLLAANITIIYTFNAGIFFVFAEFAAGFVYLLLKRCENSSRTLKKFLYTFLLTGILYLPYLYFQIKTMLGLNKSVCTLFDIFHFDLGFIFTLAQNFFTPCLVNLSNNAVNYTPLQAIKDTSMAGFVFYIVFFLVTCLYGIFAGLKKKDEKIILILSVTILFITVLISLALLHIIPLVTRYTLLVHLMAILAVSYGLNTIKNKTALITITSALVLISLFNFIFYKDTALFRKASFHYYSAQILKNAGANRKDIIIMPYFGRFLYKYHDKSALIDYRSEELLLESDAFLMKETFNLTDNEYENPDKSNLKIQNYINSTNPPHALEEYLYKNYISKMQKNTRLFLIENYNPYIIPPNMYKPIASAFNPDEKNLPELYKSARYGLLYTKILYNLENIFKKHLKLVKIYESKEQDVKILEFLYEK